MASKDGPPANGVIQDGELPLNRADEVSELLTSVRDLLVPFIRTADEDAATKHTGHGLRIPGGAPRTTLVEHHPPQKLSSLLEDELRLPQNGKGKEGLVDIMQKVLQYSVNTWDQGFMDKLYASTNAVGLASELLLAALNTNVHVYQVSPVLTLVEKATTRALAALFGFTGPHAGGISQPGGSASNQSSLLVARNTLFPSTKTAGHEGQKFVLFTSAHGHYSLEKAAQMYGFGSNAVRSVPVDDAGCMKPDELAKLVKLSREQGEVPFYVNATAGTTVLGSFDPIDALADVCEREKLWLHVDGSWGGPVIFSPKLSRGRLKGVERADSVAITPHKMLGVPLTCSFLLGRDVRQFHAANTLRAGYLFHNDVGAEDGEVWDLADLTPQCGRKGEALKMYLGWSYCGTEGYKSLVENAFDTAGYLFDLLERSPNVVLVSSRPLPCLQVCFYYTKGGSLSEDKEKNSRVTSETAMGLVRKGWMVDYAPGEKGKFFRVVVGRDTRRATVEGLVKAVEEVAGDVWERVVET